MLVAVAYASMVANAITIVLGPRREHAWLAITPSLALSAVTIASIGFIGLATGLGKPCTRDERQKTQLAEAVSTAYRWMRFAILFASVTITAIAVTGTKVDTMLVGVLLTFGYIVFTTLPDSILAWRTFDQPYEPIRT